MPQLSIHLLYLDERQQQQPAATACAAAARMRRYVCVLFHRSICVNLRQAFAQARAR